MFDAEGHIVIANFSSADFVPSTEISRCNQDWPHSLRPEYRAPEVLLGWAHNAAADCWSFGMLFYFMLFGTVFIYASFLLNDIDRSPYSIPLVTTKSKMPHPHFRMIASFDPQSPQSPSDSSALWLGI